MAQEGHWPAEAAPLQDKPDASAMSFSRPGEQLIFLARAPQRMSKQFGRLALGPQSHGRGGEVSAKSLAPRAPSMTEQVAAERGEIDGTKKGRGRGGCEKDAGEEAKIRYRVL